MQEMCEYLGDLFLGVKIPPITFMSVKLTAIFRGSENPNVSDSFCLFILSLSSVVEIKGRVVSFDSRFMLCRYRDLGKEAPLTPFIVCGC